MTNDKQLAKLISMSPPVLNERSQQILKAIIERYISDGEPVGSKALVEQGAVDLSPATVRNIMAELVDVGFLQSPHTSAGRIPTDQGYRFFVDSLLTVQSVQQCELKTLQKELTEATDQTKLVESTSSVLSNLTNLAGVVTVPRREKLILRHVEFLPLTSNRILVVLVINEKEVQNRVIATKRQYSESELQQAANYLNTHYAGKELTKVQQKIKQAMHDDRSGIADVMNTLSEVADQAFVEEKQEDYVLAGETNLLTLAEDAGLDRMRSLFEAFNQKRDLLHLLDQCLNTDGVQIFIGEESCCDALDECSLVTAPYKADGKVVGVLGVIGPTRMQYNRVIAMVDITAKLLSAALKE